MPLYLDCNATTPIEPQVRDKIIHYLDVEYGNAASRTHTWGTSAKQAVQKARAQVAQVIDVKAEEVIFTSGATESNNLAILGLEAFGSKTGKKHIVSTTIEHKAVLEPIDVLAQKGFEVTLVSPDETGRVKLEDIQAALREDTMLVSVMQANNETGVLQPISDLAEMLMNHEAFFHVDAAQGFGKEMKSLTHKRIDLISISGHKIFGPKGIGALVTKRRGFKKLPLTPLMFGGGHERGLRPGTLPVHLIVGLGEASDLAIKNHVSRQEKCMKYRERVLEALNSLNPQINGDKENILPHVLNLSFPAINSEAAIVALKDIISFSNGSACTSQSYELSHVLVAMGLTETRIKNALRISWCHMSEHPDWNDVVNRLSKLS